MKQNTELNIQGNDDDERPSISSERGPVHERLDHDYEEVDLNDAKTTSPWCCLFSLPKLPRLPCCRSGGYEPIKGPRMSVMKD